jgi:hypothetical protein
VQPQQKTPTTGLEEDVSYHHCISLEMLREDRREKSLNKTVHQDSHVATLVYLYVGGTLDDLKGGVDRSTEIADQRNSRYGVPFSTWSIWRRPQ